ncbi:MAG TPA: hypothetical protein VF507_05930 [Pyrinomonadaceae bacterium]|jgi:hypothetical protein
MKKTLAGKGRKSSGEMRREYEFDYSKSKPNRFAARASRGRAVVVLDPDIAEVFTTPESVNNILRALIAALPRKRRRNPLNK